ncbi:MAG TPA: hypothetical protein VFS12_13570, partial [Terriglobia bacterium]|nr:hypothetical protein [Terriglobia bacterium]
VLWMTTVNIANAAGTYGLAIEPLSSEMILSAGSAGNAVWASQTDVFPTWPWFCWIRIPPLA